MGPAASRRARCSNCTSGRLTRAGLPPHLGRFTSQSPCALHDPSCRLKTLTTGAVVAGAPLFLAIPVSAASKETWLLALDLISPANFDSVKSAGLNGSLVANPVINDPAVSRWVESRGRGTASNITMRSSKAMSTAISPTTHRRRPWPRRNRRPPGAPLPRDRCARSSIAGFKGFVAPEFIPKAADSLASLRDSVRICDV